MAKTRMIGCKLAIAHQVEETQGVIMDPEDLAGRQVAVGPEVKPEEVPVVAVTQAAVEIQEEGLPPVEAVKKVTGINLPGSLMRVGIEFHPHHIKKKI
jgi:hypothetical protein